MNYRNEAYRSDDAGQLRGFDCAYQCSHGLRGQKRARRAQDFFVRWIAAILSCTASERRTSEAPELYRHEKGVRYLSSSVYDQHGFSRHSTVERLDRETRIYGRTGRTPTAFDICAMALAGPRLSEVCTASLLEYIRGVKCCNCVFNSNAHVGRPCLFRCARKRR